MSAQPTVLQVVILRDGLLVGTEVFVPGQYTLGSGAYSDLKLDDPSVGEAHATLYFQNGKAAVQDQGSVLGVFVNGHRVTACEVRPVDEVAIGPFSLKIRVLAQKPPNKQAPPPELAALFGASPPAGAAAPRPQTPVRAAALPAALAPKPVPATVVSTRRAAAPAPAVLETTVPLTKGPPNLRAVAFDPEDETMTESVMLGDVEPGAHHLLRLAARHVAATAHEVRQQHPTLFAGVDVRLDGGRALRTRGSPKEGVEALGA